MGLLIERMDSNLTESKIITDENKEKKYIIEGVFLQSNVKNGNGRIYPESVMDNAVNIYIEKYLKNNRACGELEHPEEDRTQQIVLRFVSHKITELNKVGTDWYGKAEIGKNTPMGATVAGLMDLGIVLGTSSRARGSVKNQNGVSIVQNDFRLITPSDIVYEPSAPDALLNSIMENKEWVFENGILIEKEIDQIQNQVNTSIRNKTFDKNELFNSILNMIEHKK